MEERSKRRAAGMRFRTCRLYVTRSGLDIIWPSTQKRKRFCSCRGKNSNGKQTEGFNAHPPRPPRAPPHAVGHC